MKKILSCVLAVALVLSLMSMTVFAATTFDDIDPVTAAGQYAAVGNQGKNADDDDLSVTDGVNEFTDIKSGNADITVKYEYEDANGETKEIFEHRYAVDIVYVDLIIDLTSLVTSDNGDILYSYVWDVNKHTYVKVDGNGNVVEDTDDSDNTTEITITGAFQLLNHSDMPIYYTANVTSDTTYGTKLVLGIDTAKNPTVTNVEVEKATIGAYDETEPTSWANGAAAEGDVHNIVATPVNSWIDTINNLVDVNVGSNPVGKLVITISATQN